MRYLGARCWRQRWTVTASLYCILWGTVSQCRSLAVTDHTRTSESQWSDVLQRSEQTATCLWLSSVQKQKLSCSSQPSMWSKHEPASLLTQRRMMTITSQLTRPEETRFTDVWHMMLVKTEVFSNYCHTKKSSTVTRWYPVTIKLKGRTTTSLWTQVVFWNQSVLSVLNFKTIGWHPVPVIYSIRRYQN